MLTIWETASFSDKEVEITPENVVIELTEAINTCKPDWSAVVKVGRNMILLQQTDIQRQRLTENSHDYTAAISGHTFLEYYCHISFGVNCWYRNRNFGRKDLE